ncbi:MAG: ribose-5-phosphate isomerase RpiA [Chlamydiia bacterium]|nr:ribose-5-phosphate isomerase RpiA [Chlamydiia bacterium]
MTTRTKAKHAAAQKAATLIESDMIVGLGSGTTSQFFIEALGAKIKEGLKIQAVASSHSSAKMAQKFAIALIDIDQAPHIDLTVDGADAIDPERRMIKGGGGALLREKILAHASRDIVIIVDETKLVPSLSSLLLPIEIVTYGAHITQKTLQKMGYLGQWRKDEQGALYRTENGHLILDTKFQSTPEKAQQEIKSIPGVVETGFFFHMAKRVIVGASDGSSHWLS